MKKSERKILTTGEEFYKIQIWKHVKYKINYKFLLLINVSCGVSAVYEYLKDLKRE